MSRIKACRNSKTLFSIKFKLTIENILKLVRFAINHKIKQDYLRFAIEGDCGSQYTHELRKNIDKNFN